MLKTASASKKPTDFDSIRIQLASPETIRAWSHGEVTKPETINYRSFKPERDGLFCERTFGPVKDWNCHCGKYKGIRYRGVVCDRCGVEVTQAKVRRERLGHIELACAVSHIWYFKSLPSRIGALLDVSMRNLERVLYYESYIVLDPKDAPGVERFGLLTEDELFDLMEQGYDPEVDMGAPAVKNLLMHIDIEELSAELRTQVRMETSVQRKQEALKRLKVVEAFRQSENRPEWLIADLAIMLANGITVPAYTTYTEKDYKYLIEDCEPTVVIVSNNEMLKKLNTTINEKSFIKKVITFDEVEKAHHNLNINNKEKYLDFDSITKNDLEDEDKIQNLNLKRSSVACIIYTSGTGGNPKGVILSHGGILNNLVGACEIMKPLIDSRPIFLTWLPLSHSYEHCVQFAQIAVGAKVFYAEKIEKLLDNISEAKPTIMTAVPRFYQNLYNKINMNMKKAKGFKKKLIKATIDLGKKELLKQKMNFPERLMNSVVNTLVRKKVKKQFGGNLKAFISGGGALDKEIGEFLNAIGLPTLQGYGLTETSPVVSCNPIHKIRVETVGPPFKGNEVKIAEDGEILVKGENVMLGYWNKKEDTAKVIKDGWLYTGDIGEIDPRDGYLKITDRKKDIIVSAGGDNISPAKIENQLSNSPEIDQCLVYGEGKKYLVALIVPSKEFKEQKEKIKKIINEINKNLTLVEKIKKFHLINENFSIENGLLTPTMKVKRNKVTLKYKQELEKLY